MEKLLIISSIIGIGSFLIFLIVYLSQQYLEKEHKRTQHKFSDAAIFKAMSVSNHFMTSKQLATISSLTDKEAKKRMQYLTMHKALRAYMNSDGTYVGVYQIKEDVPLHSSLPVSIKGLSDEEVVNTVLQYVDDYQITIAELVVIFDIDIYEAKIILNRLKSSHLVEKYRKGFEQIYVIKKPLQQTPPILRQAHQLPKTKIDISNIEHSSKIKIADADVLQLAINNKGTITPTELCVKLKIPIDTAKEKLEELYEQGAFKMDVNEQHSIMEYRLVDDNLLDEIG